MITESVTIVTSTSERTGVEYDLLKSINDIVFKDIVEWSRQPTSLIIKLDKFGSFFFKKAKTERKITSLTNMLKDESKQSQTEVLNNRIKSYNFILEEYKKFKQAKYDIKCEKYGKQNYENYILVKKQEKIQKSKEAKLK